MMNIARQHWGTHNRHEVYLLTMSNDNIEVTITNIGCTIVSLLFKDEKGNKKNLVLGYNDLSSYVEDPFYMGCIVGRFANRISNASFNINGKIYQLTANEQNTRNHLHGGQYGFNKKVFAIINTTCNGDTCSIKLHCKSTDGEEGYPGNLDLTITYTLTADNALTIDYRVITDRTTPVNLTNHSYFNLSGKAVSAVDHELYINADAVLEMDAQHIPTGRLQQVNNTALDFRKWRSLQDGLTNRNGAGYNHYYIFNPANDDIGFQAALCHPDSGTCMVVTTTYPGMMLYTADYLSNPFSPQQGICMETHLYPDSPNRPEFLQALLTPENNYHYITTYRFYNTQTG